MKYERLTVIHLNGHITISETKQLPNTREANLVLNRLAELENKIENGTLVEMPRIIHPNKAEWCVQYQYPSGVIQYDICFSEAEAEEKLKELQG